MAHSNHDTSDQSAVPPHAAGSWSQFLKNISSFSGDLSSLTAPPFILSETSLTEYSANWVSHPSLLTAPADEADPERRAVLVLKWFLSTLKQQYSSRNEKLGSEKKPLNPFLGELFLATWPKEGDGEELRLVSEQVNHHPPVTAYSITTPSGSVQLTGYNGQKASVTRSLTISVKQEGRAVLRYPTAHPDETYLITLPSLHVEGVISGSPYVELNKCSFIVSSTGYLAKIDYSGRGWLSGKKNSFRATLSRADDAKRRALYTAEGRWTEAFCVHDAAGRTVASYSAAAAADGPAPLAAVRDVEAQGEWESRRAWRKVAEAIRAGDMERTQREKSAIENRQRDLRRRERDEGRQWERRHFARAERDEVWDKLGGFIGEEPAAAAAEKTDGVWVWKGEGEGDGQAEVGAV